MLLQLAFALLTFTVTSIVAVSLPAKTLAPQAAPQPAPPKALAATPSAMLRPDPPSTCADCAEWNAPRQPFKVFGNTYWKSVV